MAAPDTRSQAGRPTLIRKIAVLLVTSLGLIVLVGCSEDRLTGGGDSGAVLPENGRPDQDSADQDESVSGGGGGLPETVPENVPPGGGTLTEQIVRTGDLSVDVDDITSAANRITALVEAANGNVGSDQRYGDANDGTADLVLRVPPDRFDELIETIGGLGEELSRSVAAEDVSTVVADVDARVTSLQNSVDRLLALGAQAVSVSDLITIEAELSARQSELESLQAQQRALSDQVSLATLSVALTASTEPDSDQAGFLDSIAEGWNALLDTGRGLLAFVGLLIPWLALLAVIVLPLWFLLRRRRTPAVTGPPATVSGQAVNEPARPPE